MSELAKEPVLKTGEPARGLGSSPSLIAIWRIGRVVESAPLLRECALNRVPRVQIPHSPPYKIKVGYATFFLPNMRTYSSIG